MHVQAVCLQTEQNLAPSNPVKDLNFGFYDLSNFECFIVNINNLKVKLNEKKVEVEKVIVKVL